MANSKSQQYEVEKNSDLCLNKFCADINDFGKGFNKKNSPVLGGAITNVFKNSESGIDGYYSDGKHEIKVEGNNVLVDGILVEGLSIDDKHFEIENISNEDYLFYIDDETYVKRNADSLLVLLNNRTHNVAYNNAHKYYLYKSFTGKAVFIDSYTENDSTYNIFKNGIISIYTDNSNDSFDYTTAKYIPKDYESVVQIGSTSEGDVCILCDYIDSNREALNQGLSGVVTHDGTEGSSTYPYCISSFYLDNFYKKMYIFHGYSINEINLIELIKYPDKTTYNSNNTCVTWFTNEHGEVVNGIRHVLDSIVSIPVIYNDKVNVFQYWSRFFDKASFVFDSDDDNRYIGTYFYPTNSNFYNVIEDFRFSDANRVHIPNNVADVYYDQNAPEGRRKNLIILNNTDQYSIFVKEFYSAGSIYPDLWPGTTIIGSHEYEIAKSAINSNYYSYMRLHNNYPLFDMIGLSRIDEKIIFNYYVNYVNDLMPSSGFYNVGIFSFDTFGTYIDRTYNIAIGGYYYNVYITGQVKNPNSKFPKFNFYDRILLGGDSINGYFYYLINNDGIIQGISYSKELNEIGTLVVPWNRINGYKIPYYKDGKVTYYNNSNNIMRISIEDGAKFSLTDNYLLINTTSYQNAVDLTSKKPSKWALDWNSRFINNGIHNNTGLNYILAYNIQNSDVDGNVGYLPYGITIGLNLFDLSSNFIKIAGGYNNIFQDISNNYLPSAQLPEYSIYFYSNMQATDIISLMKAWLYDSTPNQANFRESVLYGLNIYKGDDSLAALVSNPIPEGYYITKYVESNAVTPIEETLYIGTEWISTYYNPAITMEFVDTFLSNDAMRFWPDNILYFLQFLYGKQILLYELGGQSDNIEDFFAVQGQPYAIMNDSIYKYTLQNATITGFDIVCRKTGLKYLCFTSKAAYFWSAMDSSIYVFTADNILKKMCSATSINRINNAIYYSSCDTVAFSTNCGILCINEGLGIFIIGEKLDTVEYNDENGRLYLNKDGYIAYYSYDSEEETGTVTYFSFTKVVGWIKETVEISTKYYGSGSNIISITDCWYIRLYASPLDFGDSRTGKITLYVNALTDQGYTTEVKKDIEIKEKDWDILTNTLYIRYQPKLQRAVGIQLNVISDYPIAYIGLGNIPETTQMSRAGMQV